MDISFFKKGILKTKQTISRGFTLIEMMVVIAIFAVLTAIIVFNYGDFNADIVVSNMAYEIALTTRQAQIFGLGSRGTGGEFQEAYGIYINNSGGPSKDLIFFGDTLSSNWYCNNTGTGGDCTCAGADDECLERLTLQKNIVIDKLQVFNGSICSEIDELAISYKRPNPEAQILDQENASGPFQLAMITVLAPGDRQRHVIIRKNGQISVVNDAGLSVEVHASCIPVI